MFGGSWGCNQLVLRDEEHATLPARPPQLVLQTFMKSTATASPERLLPDESSHRPTKAYSTFQKDNSFILHSPALTTEAELEPSHETRGDIQAHEAWQSSAWEKAETHSSFS